jgi:hypothetical protein
LPIRSTWPENADGDVFRKLSSSGFDFTKLYTIDFNIDFDQWPPAAETIQIIQKTFPGAKVYEDDDANGGYILFKLQAKLTYELVMDTQAKASVLVAPFGGRCESWGVLH